MDVSGSCAARPALETHYETGDRGFLNRCLWDLLLSVPNAELPGRGMPLVKRRKPAPICLSGWRKASRFPGLPGSNFRLFLLSFCNSCRNRPGGRHARPAPNARMGGLEMNTPERKVFFYSRAWAILVGGLLFAMGATSIAIFAHELLRLSPSGRQPPNWIYVWLIVGVPSTFGGLLYILRTISDRRPVLVVDSEGVFYRPHGDAIVPWRDILAVEEGDDGGSELSDSLILTRRSGPPMSIELLQLSPAAGSAANRGLARRSWRRGRRHARAAPGRPRRAARRTPGLGAWS